MLIDEDTDPTEGLLPGGHGPSCPNCPLGGVNWPNGCPCRERHFTAGDTLIEQGDTPQGVMLLKEGLVGLSTVSDKGVETGCTVRAPKTLLGSESVYSMRTTYRVWALTDLTVCVAPIERLKPWLGSLSTPFGALMRLSVEESSRRVTERLERGGSSVSRIARLLLRRCVNSQPQRLELSQRLVARVLSMTPETISRALGKLHAAGAVSSTRPIVIGDVEKLRKLAEE
jgi:CRP-like cAMP-binding protein